MNETDPEGHVEEAGGLLGANRPIWMNGTECNWPTAYKHLFSDCEADGINFSGNVEVAMSWWEGEASRPSLRKRLCFNWLINNYQWSVKVRIGLRKWKWFKRVHEGSYSRFYYSIPRHHWTNKVMQTGKRKTQRWPEIWKCCCCKPQIYITFGGAGSMRLI